MCTATESSDPFESLIPEPGKAVMPKAAPTGTVTLDGKEKVGHGNGVGETVGVGVALGVGVGLGVGVTRGEGLG